MKPTQDNFWLLISVALFVIVVGTAWTYAFRPFGTGVVSQENSAIAPTGDSPSAHSHSSGQAVGCGI